MLKPLAAIPLLLAAAQAQAAGSSYVFCDNGLRCVKAPCPSSNALDLGTGAVVRGASIDTGRLPRKDRTPDAVDRLHVGRLVVRGFVEMRTRTYTGRSYDLPYLVATTVERAATAAEGARCTAR